MRETADEVLETILEYLERDDMTKEQLEDRLRELLEA